MKIISSFLAIKSPYAYCNPLDGQEHADTRPPFANYGGKYSDKSRGEKRTFNSRAIHVSLFHFIT